MASSKELRESAEWESWRRFVERLANVRQVGYALEVAPGLDSDIKVVLLRRLAGELTELGRSAGALAEEFEAAWPGGGR